MHNHHSLGQVNGENESVEEEMKKKDISELHVAHSTSQPGRYHIM